tara:strand:+ start:604 stop:1227 length:624 start_codon:yes stop_codon:yes gene_type:complete
MFKPITLDSGSAELEINSWFPTLIGVSFYKNHNKEAPGIIKHLSKIKSECPESIGQPSFFLHSCHKDKKLNNLNKWIQARVDDYTKFYGFPKKCKPVESWFHWCKEHNYLDNHVHLGRTISVIYYLQSDIRDSRVFFDSPAPPDMRNPFKITANHDDVSQYKPYSHTECFYKPMEGMLLIFRSFISHKVEMKNNKLKDRILISWDLD